MVRTFLTHSFTGLTSFAFTTAGFALSAGMSPMFKTATQLGGMAVGLFSGYRAHVATQCDFGVVFAGMSSGYIAGHNLREIPNIALVTFLSLGFLSLILNKKPIAQNLSS